jgi:sterol desaturase/sphingolipid hydroxylase (fatty acid hydroxylase superfamily)
LTVLTEALALLPQAMVDAGAAVAARLKHAYIDGFGASLSSLAVAAAVVVAVLAGEALIVGWKSSSAFRLTRLSRSARTDLLAFVLVETSLALVVGMSMFFGVTYLLQKLIAAELVHIEKLRMSSPAGALIVYFLAVDFVGYWAHRLCHRVPALWELHRYHHSAPEMTGLTAYRDHPMERAFTSLMLAAPAALIAMPVSDFVAVHALAKVIGVLKHANVRSNWGWFGRYLIQSPGAHWVHHSMDPAHHNRNFSSLFQFWDVIFRTAVHPRPEAARAIRIGLVDDPGQVPPFRYLGRVCVAGWGRLLGSSERR